VSFPAFRLTFLWRFTLQTLAVSVIAAYLLALSIENAHRSAIETDIEVSALGHVNAELTKPLDHLAAAGSMTPAVASELASAANDALLSQYVTALRVYRPSGSAVFPANAPSAPENVHRALNSDNFVRVAGTDSITAYSPIFTNGEQVFVIAVDFSPGQLSVQFQRERQQVFGIVGAVVAIIFLSLVTLAAGASRELERRRREAQSNFVDTLKLMAEAVDLRDPYTAGHSQRVAHYARLLAKALKLSPAEVDTIESGALLHDLGKIAIPDSVLFKPAALDQREREIIGTHPVIGANLLRNLHSMDDIVPCIMHHHERIDGSGYPDKLLGDAIPFGARVIAVADTFDAMTTDRPYRRALALERAVAELQRIAGTQLDARAVEVFLDLIAQGEVRPLLAPAAEEPVFGRKIELEVAS
jgi:putative nucleotidyltransferase with HDIG domain